MVQLSPFPTLDVVPPPETSEEEEKEQEDFVMDSCLKDLQLSLEASTAYHGYENYIEDGLICLRNKVRNLEKKKLKLEDYKLRLNRGDELNKDQMVAVEKYEEVLHNLVFAQELHRTLDTLTQTLLRAQKKVVKKEQMEKLEAEKRRLSTVLQVQHLLHSLQQEHVRRDLLAGQNRAPHCTAQQLTCLSQLAALLGVKRDYKLGLEEQMERAALAYLDLLEGNDKPAAGSTFKQLKEELTSLLNCEYFTCLPPSPNKGPKVLLSSTNHSTIPKSKPTEVSQEFFDRLYLTDTATPSTQNWKNSFHAMMETEPPDCWDVELSDGAPKTTGAGRKMWKGAATLIPRVPVTTRKQAADCKERKERRPRGEQYAKTAVQMEMPVEIFDSALPKDPIQRKQHLEDLMTKIHGSFSFMQESLLEGEISASRLTGRLPSSSSALGYSDVRAPGEAPPKAMQSTPLPTGLTNGDQGVDPCELSSKALPHEPPELAERKKFPPPPLYCVDSTPPSGLEDRSRPCTPITISGVLSPCNGGVSSTSTPHHGQTFSTPPNRQSQISARLQNIQSVFKRNTLSQKGKKNSISDATVFSEPTYISVGTQTPPEFTSSEDRSAYQSDCSVGGQMFVSPGASGGGRHGQSHHTRRAWRGMARGDGGPALSFRSSGWHRGGSYIPHGHFRDPGPLLYAARDSGYHNYRHGGGRHSSSAAWSDSSQVSSPDRDGAFTIVDSGHGDSLSVSTLEVPVTPHHHHHTLLPMHLYPLSQPLRVAFTASRTANFVPGNLDQPIVFDQLHSNLGEMYDIHIGRFNCPVNGTYVFIFHILKLAINVPLYINLMRNEEVMVSAYANDGAPDHETASNHAILPLFQGDQVWLRLHRGAIYGSTWKYSTFSGFLLYQD
ncbi:caprin-2 isoform X3 [Antennarius striatus]